MKRQYRYTIATILIYTLPGSKMTSRAQTSQADISNIKNIFNKINTDSHLNKVVLEEEEFLDQTTDGGASLTGYFSEDSLVKITSWIGLSYGIQQLDFYYDRNTLIFCYVTERHFKHSQTDIDHTRTELVFEGRYYYDKAGLLQKNLKGSGFWDTESEKAIIPDSKEYFKLVTKKKNAKTK
jgi:hypothetical protein